MSQSNGGGGGGGALPATFAPTVGKSDNGTVSVSPAAPKQGDKVTITAKPNDGYAVDAVTVIDESGKAVAVTKNSDGTYSFTQPNGKVTVSATFKEAEKPAAAGFTDVRARTYFYDAVQWAVANGITQGTTETTFSPYKSCTRAQMVTFLWRAAGMPEPSVTTTAFQDVREGAYFHKAVLWAAENGITQGTSATTFKPYDTVTRGQAVTFLYRMLNGKAGTQNPFEDVKEGKFYADPVKWALEDGVTMGTSDTTFSPDRDCLRAHIVTFLYRAYNK